MVSGAVFAGLAAGALGAVLHLGFVVPLILEGELYETGALVHFGAAGAVDTALAPEAADPGRSAGTVAMLLVTYTGFALLMMAGFALAERAGHRITARIGAVWGLAGFVAVHLAPAFGLPPELPGAAAAPLLARQIWWAACVAATAAGISALAFGRSLPLLAAGVVLIALPHLVGAPTAPYGGVVPPELAAQFATRALGAGAAGWLLLGTIAGWVWSRPG